MAMSERRIPSEVDVATVNPYRDIHKGIRTELFSTTAEAGRVDPGDDAACGALISRVSVLIEMLEGHARYEDAVIQPILHIHFPELATRIDADHEQIAARSVALLSFAEKIAETPRARALDTLYLELAEFTAAYLNHQSVEERTVLPALVEALGPEGVADVHAAIVSSIPPQVMAQGLAIMLPAMNVDNRVEMLTGIQVSAPPQIFEGIWGLANSVLTPTEVEAVASRIGLN